MKRTAVFIATTSGPVRVERITRERAPQSMVCLRRSSTVLPISASYDSFVRPGSGVIERVFGPFEDGAFRLDVSAPIESGDSWQLGAFIAHALCETAGIASEADSEVIALLTGEVDYDLAIGAVGHVAEKMHASQEAMMRWCAAGREVAVLVPVGADHQAAAAFGIPDGVRIIGVASVTEALLALGLGVPGGTSVVPLRPASLQPARRRPAPWLMAGAASLAVAGIAVAATTLWPARPLPPVAAEHIEPIKPGAIVSPPAAAIAPVSAALIPVALTPPPQLPKLAILERRAPPGRTCAEVQFGAVAAVEMPVSSGNAAASTSAVQGLCGLAVSIDNSDRAHFVAVMLDVMSGKLLYGTEQPDLFVGRTAFGGEHSWIIDVPRRLSEPFEFRVVAIGGDRAVAEDAHWFKAQPDRAAAAQELSSKGITAATLHHRVLP